jgi:hypothetical protein
VSEWQAVGPHRYRIDDDVLHWCPSGEVTAEHASQVCRLFSQQADRFGYVLWLIDAAASLPVGTEARRVYAAWMEASTRPLYVAPFRSPMPAFTMASLVMRGVQLRGGALVYSQHSDTEAQARAYLDRMRGQHQAPRRVDRTG